ncbi:PRTRC system protein C [Accumulibacter sp.]|jgi:PRTRC genetic system protein C|uniref:PRTRC system protein C n=1 Tax=Accumulibacter sp. TaxID=2053492 RepID=UPI00261F4DA7|nr:PRTRC system protein C [Accumulibacter sp.]MBU2434591.1 PRTRC system protein C [Gammaproteobacteria bacterium]MBU2451628.1 PRTRC system protein C [Gammaproteobacteria bacterium]
MSLTATAVTTVYLYNGRTLQAPPSDTPMTPDQVKQFYSAIHPDLLNAAVEGPRFEGDQVIYEFKRGVGTKG